MLFKVVFCLCLVYAMVAAQKSGCKCLGSWTKIASDQCIRPKNSQYSEFRYNGSSTFITAMKVVHKKGLIGCGWGTSYWGCVGAWRHNILVTDTKNVLIYPSTKLVWISRGGWYNLAGYSYTSPELVFLDPGLRYLRNGQKMRIWYGEDLYDFFEYDNVGYTCMDVYVRSVQVNKESTILKANSRLA